MIRILAILTAVLGGAMGTTAQASPTGPTAIPEEEIPFPLVVTQRLTPERVFLYGSDLLPQTASLEIELSYPPRPLHPLDVVLVLDTSLSSHLHEVQALAREIVSSLTDVDRAALITTGGRAELLLGFTNDFAAAQERIRDLYPHGRNRLHEALRLALEELGVHGRPDVQKAIVLSGAGLDASASPAQLMTLAEEARLQGIRIFPVGTAPYVDWVTLSRMALLTKGAFYRFSPRTGFALFREWGREVIPPGPVTLTLSLPPYVLYLGATENPPTFERIGGALSTTVLRWVLPAFRAGETWRTRIVIASTKPGRVEVFTAGWRPRVGLSVEGRYGPVRREFILPMPRLTVAAPPVARFWAVPQIPLVGEAVRFEDLSFDPDPEGEIVSWLWFFGDGSVSRERNPVHRYEAPGRYTVVLVVTDREGATALASQELEVREPLAPPPPTQEEICRRALWALLARELPDRDREAQEALRLVLTHTQPVVKPEVAEAVRGWMELLRTVERWTPEAIQQAYERLLVLLEALGPEVELSEGRRASLALTVVVHLVRSWPELRASCR